MAHSSTTIAGIRRRIGAAAALALGLSLGLAACSSGDPAPAETTSTSPQVVQLDAGTYPHYETLDDLWAGANLVILGNTGTGVSVMKDGGAPGASVITVRKVKVTEVYKGSVAAGDTIEVKQLGGELEGVTYVEPGQVTLERNTDYVLFLKTSAGSPASLVNLNQASYRIADDGGLIPATGNPLLFGIPDLYEMPKVGA